MNARAAIIIIIVGTTLASRALAGDLVVIVNAGRDVRLTREEVAQIYLKRRQFWKNGELIVPVNRDSASTERRAFVLQIFGDEQRRLLIYWNRQYFRGVLPPATLASDEAVKRFVSSERLAIGYISSNLVDASVNVVLRIDGARVDASEAILVEDP